MIARRKSWMKRPENWLVAVLASVFLLYLGSSLIMTFVSLQMVTSDYSNVTIGIVHSAFYLGLMLGVQNGERFISSVGYIRTFAGFAALLGCSIVSMETWQNPALWVAMRWLAGWSQGTLYLVLESWFVKVSHISNRGRVLAFYTALLFFSQAAGQGALHLIGSLTLAPFNFGALFCLLAIAPIAIVRMEGPKVQVTSPISFRKVVNESPLSILGSFVAGILISSLYSFVPIWAVQMELAPPLAMATVIIGGVLFLWPLGSLSDKMDRRRMLLGIVALLCATCFVTPSLINGQRDWLYGTLCLIGGLNFSLYPICVSQALDRFADENQLRISTLLLMIYGIGACIGPIYCSLWLQLRPEDGLLYGSGAITLPILFVSAYVLYRINPVPEEKKKDYRPLPRTTPIAVRIEENTDK